jgi:hypothetical protein
VTAGRVVEVIMVVVPGKVLVVVIVLRTVVKANLVKVNVSVLVVVVVLVDEAGKRLKGFTKGKNLLGMVG